MVSNKTKVKVLENAGFVMQTFHLPKAAKWQERRIREIYHAANIGRQLEGLPKKKYRYIDFEGRLVDVE